VERDFVGYGNAPPQAGWPGNARVALNFNLNYEAGGERGLLEGDESSEDMLNDIGMAAQAGVRSPLVESIFEYGSRVGVWRLLRIFKQFDVRVSVLGVVRALQRNPQVVAAFLEAGHEIVSHGWRWIDYHHVDPDIEREHIKLAIQAISEITGATAIGWMTGRPGPNTRRLLVETGRIIYDRDYLGDELPFRLTVEGKSHLVIPYSYETNDNRLNENRGFSTGGDFARYMIDCFDLLYAEGADCPRLMSVGLHDRLIGRPARAVGLIQFLDHVRKHDRVWICTGRDIADHWLRVHPP
jgi:peptidoglycan/xylan/chitin deacetylase (PgdA/CDA1 family)